MSRKPTEADSAAPPRANAVAGTACLSPSPRPASGYARAVRSPEASRYCLGEEPTTRRKAVLDLKVVQRPHIRLAESVLNLQDPGKATRQNPRASFHHPRTARESIVAG
ncbi:hypothetical protein GCM10017566_21720 [Amycolatopsis bartoniae]|uniref:Uncharacterized protein n=1 Tax=Amycolatopsis bartoniae TaxID=941986 RepID=A0A8H9IQU4_9PSEU|nr:hypothetical protein GCM10017566_21720 [Amycolatopsis bartoniae]